jgi:hypothetical protein
VKNGGAKQFMPFDAVYGGHVKNTGKIQALAALVLLGAVGFLAGCNSAPDLTQDQAKAMIQAKYDKDSGAVFNIAVDDAGMQKGVHANYWLLVKRYPNGYWGDFKLTPDGVKVVKQLSGGDTIQWRPDGPTTDPKYSRYTIVVAPLVASKFKARNLDDVQTIADTRTVTYMEDVDLSSLPAPLQDIARNPANRLSTKRMATFTLDNGAWTLKSIE